MAPFLRRLRELVFGPSESSFQVSFVQPPESAPIVQDAKLQKIGDVPRIAPITLQYAQATPHSSRAIIPPEYNLAEIGAIEDTESIVRRAFKKQIGLIFKEGLNFVSKNADALRYYKLRMAQIAQASGIPTSELLRRLVQCLVRTSNAFLVKVRKPDNSGGSERIDANGKALKPVAAYFVAAPETMRAIFDKDTGKIKGWRQQLPSSQTYKDFTDSDVIHFTIDRREGFIFGVPSIVPVIDDIRALRQLEESIELLVYHHLFPLFQYVVGTETAPAAYTEDGRRELDVAREELRVMPLEGGIVTPERHEIRLIGAESKALRAEVYLEHFKRRVIAGLGISEIDLGQGDTANRATANTMSRALIDAVKDVQDSLESQWDQEVIREILLEGPLDAKMDVLAEENMVHLVFNEIDVDNKMEQEKHALELFKGYGITLSELRLALGRDPIQLPEDPHDQDLTKYPQWAEHYWKLIEEPSLLIRATDEPYSAQAAALASSKGSQITGPDNEAAMKAKQEEEEKAAEREKETKIAVAKAKPKPPARKDSVLTKTFRELEGDTVNRALAERKLKGRTHADNLASAVRTWATLATEQLTTQCNAQLIAGINKESGNQAHRFTALVASGRRQVRERIDTFITRLTDAVVSLLTSQLNKLSGDAAAGDSDYSSAIHGVFDTLRYRLDFAWDTEAGKAFSLGRLLVLKVNGKEKVVHHSDSVGCDECRALINKPLSITHITLDEIAPHHPNCRCDFDGLDVSSKDEDLGDGAKLERCVLQVKQQLREKHPSWSDDKVKSSAYAICNTSLKK